jgi:hypothetical protein
VGYERITFTDTTIPSSFNLLTEYVYTGAVDMVLKSGDTSISSIVNVFNNGNNLVYNIDIADVVIHTNDTFVFIAGSDDVNMEEAPPPPPVPVVITYAMLPLINYFEVDGFYKYDGVVDDETFNAQLVNSSSISIVSKDSINYTIDIDNPLTINNNDEFIVIYGINDLEMTELTE